MSTTERAPDAGPDAKMSRHTVALDSEGATAILDALSSDTARSILGTLYDRPRTPSAVADTVETSIQNVGHHLDQLEDAGLVEVVATEYSDQGREMNVYGPVNESLVLYAGRDPATRTPADGAAPDHTSPEVWFGLGAMVGILATAVWRRVTGPAAS